MLEEPVQPLPADKQGETGHFDIESDVPTQGQSDNTIPERPYGLLHMCCCFKNVNDRRAFAIIITSMFYIMSVGIIIVPLKLLINKRIGGDANEPTSASVFVDVTNIFLYALMSFLCGRYNSAMSDYIGRKPILIISISCLIVTRIIYINATSAAGFYIGAIIGGTFDAFYYTGLSWICDYFPEPMKRNKRVGIYMGVVLGLSLTISAPLGAVFAENISILFPFILSPILGVICIIMLVAIPVDDTIGIQHNEEDIITLIGKRGVPRDWWKYICRHFPISLGSINIIMSASRNPLDWATNFIMHTVPALFALIMVQYCLAVFHWSPTVAALAVFSIGMTLGILGPTFLHLFNPIPLAFYAMCVFTTGLILMSVAGTGLAVAPFIGVPGIICIALGTSWIPALQTNLTTQYGSDVLGVICGLLGQQKDLATLPGWLMSLGFTFALRRNGSVYWPGSSMFMAACMGIVAISLHFYIHGSEAVILTYRMPAESKNKSHNNSKYKEVEIISQHEAKNDHINTVDP